MLAMFGLGTPELLVIGLIILVLFGANRIPSLARSIGSSLIEFKKGLKAGAEGLSSEIKEVKNDEIDLKK